MSQVVIDIIYNAALLIASGVIYDALPLRHPRNPRKLAHQILRGFLLSLIALAVMGRPWQIIPGVRIDARSILLAVSGLFFGLIPTLIVTLVAVTFRFVLGGLGMVTGFGLILSSAAIGLVWRHVRKRAVESLSWLELYAFGVLVHVVMLIWMFNLPTPIDTQVLINITAPVLILYPIVTVLLGKLLSHQTFRQQQSDSLRQDTLSLQLSEAHYRRIVDTAEEGIWVVDARGRVTYVNDKLSAILGYTREEFLGRPVTNFIHELHKETAADYLLNLQNGGNANSELAHRHKDGHIVWTRVSASILLDTNGNVDGGVALVTDISPQKRTELALRTSEELFKSLFEQSAVGTAQVNPDGDFMQVNSRLCEIVGYERDELLQKNFRMITHPDDLSLDDALIAAVTAGSTDSFVLEKRYIHKLGREVWVRLHGNTVRNTDGKQLYTIVMVVDITASRLAEEARRQQQELLQSIIDHSPVMIAMNDSAGNMIFANQAFSKTTGWDITKYPSTQELLPLIYPDEKVRQQVEDDLVNADGQWRDYKSLTRDGEAIYTSWANIALSDGRQLGFGQDITDRKLTEIALQAQKELLQTLVDHLPVMLNMTDPAGNYIFTNRAHEEMLGWSAEETRTVDRMLELAYPDPAERRRVRENIDQCRGVWQDYDVRTHDGREVAMSWIDVRLPNGNHLGIGQDITHRKLAEQQLRELNAELELRVAERTAELESRNRELQTFTYTVSHDLKAPLRGIDGYSRLLEMDYAGKLDEEGKHFLSQVRKAAALMGNLIEDLLAYSRVEQRPRMIRRVSLETIIQNILSEQAVTIQTNHTQITVSLNAIELRTDIDGLTLSLRNLIDNALKFSAGSQPPQIEIHAEHRDHNCLIWVKDNGIGFDLRFHDRIFEIFQRLHRDEEYAGTGVGLAIVQRAMHRLGGRVWAESSPGQGATFYLEIPEGDITEYE